MFTTPVGAVLSAGPCFNHRLLMFLILYCSYGGKKKKKKKARGRIKRAHLLPKKNLVMPDWVIVRTGRKRG